MTYSIDTRSIKPGETYVAIRGELHDGHAFILSAIEKGAAAIVTERPIDPELASGVEIIQVESALHYLTSKASERVRDISCDVIAITGSVGKTSTRSAIQAVLAESFPVAASTGNLNTPLGLALVVLNADLTAETKLVLEMGARIPGDIDELCSLFPPTVSVVTAVRGVHVETLGSIDGVQREKSSLVRALRAEGTACLNGDDPRVAEMASATPGRVITYGRGDACDIRPDRITVDLPIIGEHAVTSALAAFAVGQALGMDDAAINRGLLAVRPEKGRLARLPGRGGSTLIDDTYNASPDATLAALRLLVSMEADRRVALLGDMLELGETEIEQHETVLRAAVEAADIVIAVGPRMAKAAEALSADERNSLTLVPTSDLLATALGKDDPLDPGAGDVILVKGSQGIRMERVSAALLSPEIDPADVLARHTEAWLAIA